MRPSRLPAAVAAAAVTALSCAAPTMAHADDQPLTRCDDAGVHYDLSNRRDAHIPAGIDWKNGPGGTATASRETSMTATLELSAQFEVAAGVLVSEARSTFGIKATASASVKETLGFSHAISPHRYGHLQFGNWGNRMTVTRTTVNASCRVTNQQTGSVVMPSVQSWGYRYWETSR